MIAPGATVSQRLFVACVIGLTCVSSLATAQISDSVALPKTFAAPEGSPNLDDSTWTETVAEAPNATIRFKHPPDWTEVSVTNNTELIALQSASRTRRLVVYRPVASAAQVRQPIGPGALKQIADLIAQRFTASVPEATLVEYGQARIGPDIWAWGEMNMPASAVADRASPSLAPAISAMFERVRGWLFRDVTAPQQLTIACYVNVLRNQRADERAADAQRAGFEFAHILSGLAVNSH